MPAERKFVIHSNLKDSSGRLLVIDYVAGSKHLTLSPLTGAPTANQQFQISEHAHMKNVGAGVATNFATRDKSGSVPLFVRLQLEDTTATGKDTQLWSFQHIGKYTFIMLGNVLPDDDTVVDRFYLAISTAHSTVADYTLLVTQLDPLALNPNLLWFFEEV